MDSEMCRALSAALFVGNATFVEYVDISLDDEIFDSLGSDRVDIIAGERVSVSSMAEANDKGLAFSTPYVFRNDTGDAVCFVTENDSQWVDFVNWVIVGTIYAEENSVSSWNAGQMPVVGLFGQGLKQMLADTIIGVGNYGDIYNRSLSTVMPRSGRNLLNLNLENPQQFGLPLV